jgi:hypothetical protein
MFKQKWHGGCPKGVIISYKDDFAKTLSLAKRE